MAQSPRTARSKTAPCLLVWRCRSVAKPRASMGLDAGDFDNDGDGDLGSGGVDREEGISSSAAARRRLRGRRRVFVDQLQQESGVRGLAS